MVSDPAIQVQPMVRQRIAHLGIRGERWLAGLEELIEELELRWSIAVGEPLSGGTASYVARARMADDRDAILKLVIPGQNFARQVRTIAAAEGRGYAALLAQDPGRRAMLLEALGPPMSQLRLPPERMIVALCQTLRQAWTVPRPPDLTVPPEEEKARSLGHLVATLWQQLGRPCSAEAAAQALRFAEHREAAFDLDRCVIVHGDPHPDNALRAPSRPGAESGFVFADPDGFLADPAYHLGVVLRDWCPELLAGDTLSVARLYCRLLAGETGFDEIAIWNGGSWNGCRPASTCCSWERSSKPSRI